MRPSQSSAGTPRSEDFEGTDSLILEEGSRQRLTIPKASIAKLWSQVQDGVRIVPHGGIEVGGLLVGPKSRESGIVIDEIIPLSIKYEYGPCFRMSASDLASVAVLVESVQVDPSKTVVGLYRSQTRGSEIFRASDREIFAAIEQAHMSFAADFLCLFVVAPVSKSEMSACIALREGENWDRLAFTLRSDPFSLIPAQPPAVSGEGSVPAKEELKPSLASALREVLPSAQEVLPSAEEDSEVLAAPAPPPHPAGNSDKITGRLSKGFYALAGLLALWVAAGVYLKSHPAHSPASTVQQPLHVGFSANREGSLWRLSWDRRAIELMEPSGAVLTITDGKVNQQLKLTPADLSSGAILYTPRGGDLLFSLQLTHGSIPIEEHIHVLEDSAGDTKSAQGHTDAPLKNAVLQATASTRPTLATKRPRAASSRSERQKTVSPISSPSISPSSAPSETKVESASVPSPVVAPLIKPNDDPVSVAPPVNARNVSEQPVSPSTSPSVRLDPVPAETPGASVYLHAAEVPPPARSVYVGPVPIQKVPAQPPPGRDFRGVVIRIRMGIDARGKVTKATAIGVTAANFPLVPAAERAALSWQFEPATIDGRPVPTQLDLLLRF